MSGLLDRKMRIDDLRKLCEETNTWTAVVLSESDEKYILAAKTALPLLLDIAEKAKRVSIALDNAPNVILAADGDGLIAAIKAFEEAQ